MTTNLFKSSLVALALVLSACGATEQPANNAATDGDMSETIANEGATAVSELQTSDATINAAGSAAAPSTPSPVTTAPAPTRPVAVAPKVVPKPAPKAPPTAEPKPAVTPTCAPEHRALGHC